MTGSNDRPGKAVLAGKGYWGNILCKYLSDAGFDDVSIYSRSCGLHFSEFLAENDAGTVFICTPVSTHYEYVSAALNAGCNVFCEKMLTDDPQKAADLFKLAESSDRILFTDYIYRYSPSIRKMKELLPMIGDIRLIQASVTQYGKFYNDIDVIGNIGVHMLSAIGFLTDYVPVNDLRLEDHGFCQDMRADITAHFRTGGSEISVEASVLSNEKKRMICAEGSHGKLIFDMTGQNTLSFIPADDNSGSAHYYSFDEANNLITSLAAFKSCINDHSCDEYAANRQCCMYVEQLAAELGSL